MAAVGLAAAIPVTLLIRGGDDDDSPSPAETVLEATVPALKPSTVTNDSLGITASVPEGWRGSQESGTLKLRSRDRTTLITVSAPAPAGEAAGVLDAAVASIKSDYVSAQTIPRVSRELSGKRVGGLPAVSDALLARNEGGTQLRILISATSGEERTYLVQLFSALASPGERLVEAQRALNELELEG